MRIAIGQLWQESNTFNPLPTTPADFEHFGVVRGQELVEQMAETNELGGFIQSLRSWPERPEIVGLVRLAAWPGGTASAATLGWLQHELLGALERALPVDGVLLSLHGALAADGVSDVEGDLLRKVRQLLGKAVPLVATLDLHANITEQMVAMADALVLYHTYPHVDIFETGQRGTRLLRRLLIGGAHSVTAFQKLPMVVPAERASTQDPSNVCYSFRRQLEELESNPRILSAGLATVQPWLDVPEMGGAVVVAAEDGETARSACAQLAADVWRQRRAYLPELIPAAEAVRQAHEANGGLIVLGDGADATTAGAPGDSTHVLAELLKYDWPRPTLAALVAPDVVAAARRCGLGSDWTGSLGGVRDHRFSRPLSVTMTVANLFDARFVISGHLGRNLAVDMGAAAVLRRGNVNVVITSRTGAHFAPALFRAAGFDPFAASIVVAKSPGGFRADYEGHAVKIIQMQAPGCAPADFWNYEYARIPRPLWPWDELPSWEPRPTLHGTASAGV